MKDHESTEGLAFAALIGISGAIAATGFALALFAVRILVEIGAR